MKTYIFTYSNGTTYSITGSDMMVAIEKFNSHASRNMMKVVKIEEQK